MTVIVVRPGDPFDMESLGPFRDGIPGLPNGQKVDWRIPASGGRGLHGYVYEDRIEFHLDAVDASRDAVGHVLRDTKALEGAAWGALAGGAAAALADRKGAEVAAAAAVGAIGGGVV